MLKECDVQLYRQMGGVRDDLNIHEKALDILIELMKKEQVPSPSPSPRCQLVDLMEYVKATICAHLLTHSLCPCSSTQLDESVPLHGIDKAISHFEV